MSVSSRSSLLEMSTSQRLTEFNTHEDDGDEDSFVFPSTYAALADSTPGEWDSLSFRLKSRALLPPDLSSCFQFMAMGFFIDMFLVLVTIAGFERLSADANVSCVSRALSLSQV